MMAAPLWLGKVTQNVWSKIFVQKFPCTKTNYVMCNKLWLELPMQTVFARQFQKRCLSTSFPFIAQRRNLEKPFENVKTNTNNFRSRHSSRYAGYHLSTGIDYRIRDSHLLSRKVHNGAYLRREFKTESSDTNKDAQPRTSGNDIPSWVRFKY